MHAVAAKVVAWIATALTAWSSPLPKDEGARADAVQVRQQVADEVFAVAYDPAEPPLFLGEHGRARTALLLASIAAHESRLDADVRAGRCKRWQCDHGQAYGIMQIHPGPHGIRLAGTGMRLCAADDAACIKGPELVEDETTQVRVALHMLRTLGLAVYTGERGIDGASARVRRETAATWYVKHLPPADDFAVAEDEASADVWSRL